MEEPSILTSVLIFELVKSWTTASKNANKLPHKENHEEIKRKQTEYTLKENSHWMSPPKTLVVMEFLKHEKAHVKASYPEEYVALQISLKHKYKEICLE